MICVLFFEHLTGQATKVVYIEQSSANAKEGVIYYKNRVGLDIRMIIVCSTQSNPNK